MGFKTADIDLRIPYDEKALLSGNPKELAAYMLELAETIQRLLRQLTETINTVLIADEDALYTNPKNPDGSYPLGTWRFIVVGDNLERQVQITLNVWTFAGDFERPE